jgi:hypothetical protein
METRRTSASRMVFLPGIVVMSLVLLSMSCRESGVYRGHFTHGFEVNTFRACGAKTTWWLKWDFPKQRDSEALSKLRKSVREQRPRQDTGRRVVYLEVRADLSGLGAHGHLNHYTRELNVHQILVMRQPSAADCK